MYGRAKRVSGFKGSRFDLSAFIERLNRRQYSSDVVVILDAIHEINVEWSRYTVRKQLPRGGGTLSIQHPNMRKLENKINSLLFRFKTRHLLTYISGWGWGSGPAGKSWGAHFGHTNVEDYYVLQEIGDAASRGLLEDILMCQCGTWLYKRVPAQRFCSAKCRLRAFKTSDRWKAHRREYMRQYYRLNKSGKVK